MIRDITLGQYFPGDSAVHKLDPRLKIIAVIVYIAAIFIADDFPSMVVSTVALFGATLLSRVPLRFMLRGLKPIFIILLFTFLVNAFMLRGGETLFSYGVFTVTSEGLKRAFLLAYRLILLILCSSWLTLTTKPISLTDGIEYMLRPFERMGVPAHDLAMMMTIALRFIPTLLEESDKIMKAQTARGADFESGNLMRRAKNLIPLLVPLFISAFRIAQELAMAMEARCYRGGAGRTRMYEMKPAGRDFAAAVILLAFLAIIILMK